MPKNSTNEPLTIRGEVQFEDSVSRNVLERQTIQRITGARPNVLNGRIFQGANSDPVTVTDFSKGANGQRIYVLGDGQMTIEHGTFIFTNTGANKLLVTDIVYRFTFFRIPGPPISHKWVEDE
jgi:hypothetical protein